MPQDYEISICGVRAAVPPADDDALHVAEALALLASDPAAAPEPGSENEAEAVARAVLAKAATPPLIHISRLGPSSLEVGLLQLPSRSELATMIITLGDGPPTHVFDPTGRCIPAPEDDPVRGQGRPRSELPRAHEHDQQDDFIHLPKPSLSPPSAAAALAASTDTPAPAHAPPSKARRHSVSPQKRKSHTPSVSAAPVSAAAPVESLATATGLYPPPGAVRAESLPSGEGNPPASPAGRQRTLSSSRLSQVLSRDGLQVKRASGIFKRLFG